MIKNPICPVCNQFDWESIGEQKFVFNPNLTDSSLKIRLEILIYDWLKSNDNKAQLSWLFCQHCGFVCYSPRATTELVGLKYARISEKLSGKPLKQGPFGPAKPYTEKDWDSLKHASIYKERAKELYNQLKPLILPQHKILDFGGAKGAILHEFIKNGMSCDVVDYGCRNPLSGVRYLGPSLDGVYDSYDIVICNHVLEHVADPQRELLQIRQALREGGIVYVEVPFELWNKKSPSPREPVTHINYFSVESLGYLLKKTGYNLIHCHYDAFRTYSGKKSLAVKALGIKAPTPKDNALLEKADLTLLNQIRKGSLTAVLEQYMPGCFRI